MAHPLQLDGAVAIVTGGSRGIGLAIAAALLDAGGRVVISGLSESHLGRARETLGLGRTDAADRVATVSADVRDVEGVERLVDTAVSRFGGLDVLVNNAGVGEFAQAGDMSPAQWRHVVDTNLTGVFQCCHAAIPHMKRRGRGWIINISSLASKNPFAGGGAYCASKAGLNALSEVLMQELRYDNIRVSYIMPGSVRTGFAGQGVADASWKIAPEDVARVVVDLLAHDPRSLPSAVELRPAKPPRR